MRKYFDTGSEIVSLTMCNTGMANDILVTGARMTYERKADSVHLTLSTGGTRTLILPVTSTGECPKLKEFLDLINSMQN